MSLRCRPRLLALVGVALSAAGCAGRASAIHQNNGNQLTVYSSMPLQGSTAASSLGIVNAEKLALAESGGEVGQFRISYDSLDDSNPLKGRWDPGITASNAKIASQDRSTIAYLGDYNSGATAVSLPLMNANGILQISPGSPYVGLTSAQDAGQDEPGRFYPANQRTFGRLAPGDQVQGAALAQFLSRLAVRRLYVINDNAPFEVALAQIVAGDARARGVGVLADDGIDTRASDFSGEVKKVKAAAADAVFFSGGASAGVVTLWRQLHAADPRLRLLGSSALADRSFTTQLGSSGPVTYLSTPVLPSRRYPPAAQRFFADYRRHFGVSAPPEALYGYEAMQDTLLAIRAAGSHGNDRPTVVARFFGIRRRSSVLGTYSVAPSGDTTLSYFAVDRVRHGQPVFAAELYVAPPAGSP